MRTASLPALARIPGKGLGYSVGPVLGGVLITYCGYSLGQTMGAAEVGRELGDAGGPLLVGAVAAVSTLGFGLGSLAAVLALIAAVMVGRPERARGRA